MRSFIKFNKIIILFLIIAASFLYPKAAYADFGPKDSLVIHVKNAPSEPYYLDLLTQHSGKYNNLNQTSERDALNQDMLKLLCNYENEGWKPALVEGTKAPMFGKLVGEENGNEMIHTFGYVGLPKTYKIIIVTQSGKISVSDINTRQALQSSITYDYSTGKTTVPSIWVTYVIQYLSTYTPTLIIEGIILLLFGFKLRDNWKAFLIINTITQVLLTLTVGVALIKSGTTAYFIQFPVEIIITFSETILFRKYLIGQSDERKSAYGVVANLVSWGVGFLLLGYLRKLLLNFL